MRREQSLVELVDETGRAVGTSTVEDAHEAPGQLHRAFSVQLVDPAGRLLLQRRAATKTRFPLRWANTCCGHPGPGESVVESAGRRLTEEVGLSGVPLTEIGVYVYRAADPVTGRTEHEFDHVLLGRVPDGVRPKPDPTEVAELRWATLDELRAALDTDASSYAPWLVGVLRRLPG